MSGAPRILAAAVLASALALAALAHAEGGPVAGGAVPSTLALSLSEPSPFRRVGRTADGEDVYVSTIRAEVTATDAPTRLSLGLEGTPLRLWREPLAGTEAKLRLRRVARSPRALRNSLAVVTLTAGGP